MIITIASVDSGLALEVAGQFASAIDAYVELMPRREQRRAYFRETDLVRWAQMQMTWPYARFSRCVYSRYLSEGVFQDAIWAADLLERHRARAIQARGIANFDTDASQWTASPLRTAASLLDVGCAVVCLGWHPISERIHGRWIAVGLEGGDLQDGWVHETNPPTRLMRIHEWFSDGMQHVSRQAGIDSMPAFHEALELLVPANEVIQRLIELWSALGIGDRRIGELHLSAEDYALQLPWSAASLVAMGDAAPRSVSVVPSTALIGRRRQQASSAVPHNRVVISTVLPEEAFCLADEIERRRPSEAEPVRVHDQSSVDDILDTDTLILLGHGGRQLGLHGFVDSFRELDGRTMPRTAILFGCWSSHLDQDPASREVEGLAVSLLGAGTEAVVASLWPVAFPAGREFIVHFIEELDHGAPHGAAFAVARDALRRNDEYAHPAIWAGFTLLG